MLHLKVEICNLSFGILDFLSCKYYQKMIDLSKQKILLFID